MGGRGTSAISPPPGRPRSARPPARGSGQARLSLPRTARPALRALSAGYVPPTRPALYLGLILLVVLSSKNDDLLWARRFRAGRAWPLRHRPATPRRLAPPPSPLSTSCG